MKNYTKVDINIVKSSMIEQSEEEVARTITEDLKDDGIEATLYFTDEYPEKSFTIMYINDEWDNENFTALEERIQSSIDSYVY